MNGTTRSNRPLFLLAAVCAVLAVAALAIPVWIIRPFVPQQPRALDFALALRRMAPVVSGVCALIVLLAAALMWSRSRWPGRAFLVLAVMLAVPAAALTHVNIFERMFHPNLSPTYGPAAEASIEPTDMLLAVSINGHDRAFPIRTMGYHHIINDTLGGQPIAVTYCTLCHTGLVWSREVNGRILHFRLAGINNGNALLRDEETSSVWQQSTGESIFGALRGQHLRLVSSAELTFALWRSEHPNGDVLRPDPSVAAEYDPKDWEQHVARTRVVVDVGASGVDPHEIIVGVRGSIPARAYPLRALLASGLIEDSQKAGGVLLVVGPDNASIRAFAPGAHSFVRSASPSETDVMSDTETGSQWSFQGCAASGPLSGQCLQPIDSHKSFWFDWLNHYRETSYFRG